MSGTSTTRPAPARRGFTVVEIVLALVLMVVVMGLVAKVGYHALVERGRIGARLAAQEAAQNVLEAARATPWEELTPQWAAAQRLPEEWTARQSDGKLEVRVEGEAPLCKRVTVAIRWEFREGMPPQEVSLVTLFSARDAPRPAKGKTRS
jgi:Tfp pilus assembly protein PilE